MKQQLLRLLFLLAILFAPEKSKAQFVTIPDTNFVKYLQTNFPGCMNGNMMDTTCGAVVNATNLNCSNKNISDFTGIKYFDNLISFACSYNQLTHLPQLPKLLVVLTCENSQLTSIPSLPNSLKYLNCKDNQLSSLPVLPNSLTDLYCNINQLTSLPTLPSSLNHLECNLNQLTSMPTLPNFLTLLYCNYNQLTTLPALPNSLRELRCWNNQLISLPVLPISLLHLLCASNQLTSLPALPITLYDLDCESNHLTSLPLLNLLPSLNCSNNQLTSLPALPDFMEYLNCSNNPNIHCLPKINTINYLYFGNTGVQCVPNYGNVTFSNPTMFTMPLCNMFNSDGCNAFWNISGNVYSDTNSNCLSNSNEPKYSNMKLNLYYDGFIQQSTYTNFEGEYAFETDTGIYTIEVDTTNLPYIVDCPSTFFDTAYIAANDSFRENKNFALGCKLGFDVGTSTVLRDSGIFRPANFANVKVSLAMLATTTASIVPLV